MNNKKYNYCCDKFRRALESLGAINYGLLGDKNYYYYMVLIKRNQTEEDIKFLDDDNNRKIEQKIISKVLPCEIDYCNFCGTKLENE